MSLDISVATILNNNIIKVSIYTALIELKTRNREIQPFLLAIRKCLNLTLSWIGDNLNEKKWNFTAGLYEYI
jgi:hypothetical protein